MRLDPRDRDVDWDRVLAALKTFLQVVGMILWVFFRICLAFAVVIFMAMFKSLSKTKMKSRSSD